MLYIIIGRAYTVQCAFREVRRELASNSESDRVAQLMYGLQTHGVVRFRGDFFTGCHGSALGEAEVGRADE